ncbi:MAG: chloride channel protein, partial [Clostridia bacterium]|nr:chloride channel protein [Clostridia bacterium]
MHNSRLTYIKNILLPCLLFSGIAGAGTGVLIFLFKLCAGAVIDLSGDLYASVRETPAFLPLLIGGAALLGLAASVILRKIPDCRGGGIPTAIAIVKGLIPFHWVKSIVFVFTSAMLTYLCGVPLGNEGPSVQMGTAVGRGIVRKYPAWNRYIMTGGACAGFAAATGSPLTGILFAFEE